MTEDAIDLLSEDEKAEFNEKMKESVLEALIQRITEGRILIKVLPKVNNVNKPKPKGKKRGKK